jgi:type III protein arginine methyltransferase
MDQLDEAVRRARYNETIHLTIETPSEETTTTTTTSSTEDICLVPTITAGGSIEFQRLTEERQMLARELQTKQWFFPMLNDTKRNILYDQCIQKHVAGKIVLDIGSGTGLLSLLAERHGAQHVTSLEMSTLTSRIAQATITANHSTRIELRNDHSTETSPLEPKAQVCMSELLEDGLLGEGWLPAMRDAWARHLTSDAIVIPSRACVYGQFVFFDHHRHHHHAPTGPNRDNTIVLGTTNATDNHNLLETTGRVLPLYTTKLLKSGQIQTVSDVFSIFDFDVSSPDKIPNKGGSCRTIPFEPSSLRGKANAVMVWWKLGLDDSLWYEIDPSNLLQDHWHPCLHFTPQDNADVTLYASHDDERIKVWLIPIMNDDKGPLAKKSKVETEPTAPIASIGRALQLGYCTRMDRLRDVVCDALQSHDHNLVLDVSDFPIGGCIAAKHGAKRVVSLESSTSDLPMQAARMAQVVNRLQNLDVFNCYPESLSVGNLGSTVDIVVAEPYYEMLEGWHLAEALHLYGILQTLRTSEVVTNATRVVPSSCQIRGCLIQCNLLEGAYHPCGDTRQLIQGIDHSFINDLAWSPQFPVISIPLWQYEYTELSEPFDLGFLSYSAPESSVMEMTIVPGIIQSGICHGLKIWVQYSSFDDEIIWSTDDDGYNQLIQMTAELFPVTTGHNSVRCKSIIGPMVNGKECQRFQIDLIPL